MIFPITLYLSINGFSHEISISLLQGNLCPSHLFDSVGLSMATNCDVMHGEIMRSKKCPKQSEKNTRKWEICSKRAQIFESQVFKRNGKEPQNQGENLIYILGV